MCLTVLYFALASLPSRCDVCAQIGSKSMAVGKLFAMQYDPSTAFLLATAGSKGHVALWHSDDDEAIEAR